MKFSTKRLRNTQGGIASLIAVVLCIVIALFLFVNKQWVIDQVSVWQFQPPADIASMTQRMSLSDKGRFYFYATHPAVEVADKFNQECDRKEASTAILGCYDGRFIYIYNVTDPKLDGIREVTAAHEMLHAVYDRLSSGEKDHLNTLLEAEYTKLKDDVDFAQRMAFYVRTEPGERDNELHSIIGTEVATINPELEAHYKNYFTDRAQVISLHQKYASIFLDLQRRSDELSQQLTQLETSIETASVEYNSNVTQLNKDIANFNAKSNAGGFSTNEQFRVEREELVARAHQLEVKRQTINDTIGRYNQLRDELVSIASQSEALNRSINSSLAPAPSL